MHYPVMTEQQGIYAQRPHNSADGIPHQVRLTLTSISIYFQRFDFLISPDSHCYPRHHKTITTSLLITANPLPPVQNP